MDGWTLTTRAKGEVRRFGLAVEPRLLIGPTPEEGTRRDEQRFPTCRTAAAVSSSEQQALYLPVGCMSFTRY